jgi:hypothetical protein
MRLLEIQSSLLQSLNSQNDRYLAEIKRLHELLAASGKGSVRSLNHAAGRKIIPFAEAAR